MTVPQPTGESRPEHPATREDPATREPQAGHLASLPTVMREWGRIGCIGFGGPPAHIALLRRLCVDDRGWLAAGEFEDGVAAVNLLSLIHI